MGLLDDIGNAASGLISNVGSDASGAVSDIGKGDFGGALQATGALAGNAFGIPGANTQAALLSGNFSGLGAAASQDLVNFQKSSKVAQAVVSGNPEATLNAATSFGKVNPPGLKIPAGLFPGTPPQMFGNKVIGSNDVIMKAFAAALHPVAIAHLQDPAVVASAENKLELAKARLSAAKANAAPHTNYSKYWPLGILAIVAGGLWWKGKR